MKRESAHGLGILQAGSSVLFLSRLKLLTKMGWRMARAVPVGVGYTQKFSYSL